MALLLKSILGLNHSVFVGSTFLLIGLTSTFLSEQIIDRFVGILLDQIHHPLEDTGISGYGLQRPA